MNVLVALAVAPCGTGEELSAEVAEVIRVIRASGLPNRTNSMFTEIEGEWDDVMRVVKDATFVLAEKGIRTEVVLKADVRPGHTDMMHKKTEVVEKILGKRRISQFEAMSGDFFVRQGRGREGVAELRQVASDAAWRKKPRHGPEGLV